MYVSVLDRTIQELRETSGNTETATGTVSSGVTAASAIAALQEASGKGSRDSTLSAYRGYSLIVELCIELIRQFYDLPRQFRILGAYGAEQFVSYSNAGLRPRHQGEEFGQDMGYRLPLFDIRVEAQKKNAYSRVAQNELAMQFFKMGFFRPEMTDQALLCLDMMDFDGKDAVVQQVARSGDLYRKLTDYMQLSLALAAKADPQAVEVISRDVMATLGGSGMAGGGQMISAPADSAGGGADLPKEEPKAVSRARERAQNVGQPGKEEA